MTLGSKTAEENNEKVYTIGEGWHRHFRRLYDEDVGDSQPKNCFDFNLCSTIFMFLKLVLRSYTLLGVET